MRADRTVSCPVEACVLAGGLSTRMGLNKASVRLRGRSLLGWAKLAPKELGFKIRVIGRDLVARCGPLGGVYTALRTTDCSWAVFLSCDMPFVGVGLLERLSLSSRKGSCAFVEADCYAGFPFILSRATLGLVEQMIAERQYSLQELARRSGAERLNVAEAESWRMTNVNTPEMFEVARLLARAHCAGS